MATEHNINAFVSPPDTTKGGGGGRDAFALVPRAAGTGSGKIKLQSFHRY